VLDTVTSHRSVLNGDEPKLDEKIAVSEGKTEAYRNGAKIGETDDDLSPQLPQRW